MKSRFVEVKRSPGKTIPFWLEHSSYSTLLRTLIQSRELKPSILSDAMHSV